MSKKDKSEKVTAEEEVIIDDSVASKEKETLVNEEQIDPLVEAQEQLQNEKDRYLRLFAEFENYKKRTSKERIDLFKTAGREIMESMLPIADDFDRAIKEIEKSDDNEHFQGVQLISNKFKETLKSKGLSEIETVKGEVFDAEIHEAITQIPSPSEDMKGKIIDVIEKGYMLGERIIRFPKVVIGQ